jgi:hypothetical protein
LRRCGTFCDAHKLPMSTALRESTVPCTQTKIPILGGTLKLSNFQRKQIACMEKFSSRASDSNQKAGSMNIGRLSGLHRTISRHFVLYASLLMLMAFALFSESAWAMRCGTHLITAGRSPGPSQIEVLQKCGEPYSQSGNRWIYVKGQSIYRLLFSEISGLVSIKQEITR